MSHLRWRIKCSVFLISMSILFILPTIITRCLHISFNPTPKKPVSGLVDPNTKIILFWNRFFNREHPDLHNDLSTCAVRTCTLTDDRAYLQKAATVVIHAGNAKVYDLPSPNYRRPDQYYAFYLMENPYRTALELRRPPWPGFFNLTWTYRSDSDIVSVLYLDQFRPKLWQYPVESHRDMLKERKDAAAALISHCAATSNRDLYIQELARYFPVRLMGECASSNNSVWEHNEDVVRQYKFYLAFENGFCKDYVTEKANRGFYYETLPVMMGSSNYSAIYPPHSFVNTADFAAPKDLAVHLWYLVHNLTAYEEYFAWKYEEKYLRVPSALQSQNNDICKLCEFLNQPNPPVKIYPDIYEWWTVRSQCFTPIVTGRKMWSVFPVTLYFWACGFLVVLLSSGIYAHRKKSHRKIPV